MLRLRAGKVLRVLEEQNGVQTLEVELAGGGTARALYYFGAADPCRPGDAVTINATAVELALGTGGYDFVVAREGSGPAGGADLYPTQWGHVVKMRYTPLQMAVDCVEDPHSPWHDLFLDESLSLAGTPVLLGELHSMLPMLVLAVRHLQPSARIVYVMTDSAALPAALSRHAARLKRLGWLHGTISAGQAWGGDWEAVNMYTGLLAARHVARADIIVCMPGPGVAGTGTPLGFSGIELAEAIHATAALGGIPVVVPRISFADPRERHRGLSHHTRTVLGRFAFCPVLLPIPRFGDGWDRYIEGQLAEARLGNLHFLVRGSAAPSTLQALADAYPEPMHTMGRSPREDPAPFHAAYVAAEVACFCLSEVASTGFVWSPGPRALAALAASWSNRPTA